MKIEFKKNGAFILSTGNYNGKDDIYYAYIDKEINKELLSANGYDWLSSRYFLGIPINTSFSTPQMIGIGMIKNFYHIRDIIKEVIDKNNIKIEDICVPFLGGINNDNFIRMYRQLTENEVKTLWEARCLVKDYYEKLF